LKTKLKILFLTPRFPYPLIGGDRIKPYYLLKKLAENYEVYLVSLNQNKSLKDSDISEIEKLGIKVKVFPISAFSGGLSCGLHLFNGKPFEINYYTDNKMKVYVDDLLKEVKFDIAFSFFMRTAEYLKNTTISKILVAEDCRTVYQFRSYKSSSSILQRVVRYWEYIHLRKYEPTLVNHFDITTLVSNQDIRFMKERNDNVNYELLSNGVDTNLFSPLPNNSRQDILFTGKLDIWANLLMIKEIVRNIMPKIWSEMPDVKFNIVGAKPVKEVLDLNSERIRVHSDVPSVIPFLQSTALFLHPHKGATGIQNKLLEAMSCACPVVTTPTGNQGIDGIDGEHLLLSKNSLDLAEKALFLLKNNNEANLIGAKARQLIIDTHSWEFVFSNLDELIQRVILKKE